jgi:hypothetical protein
VGEGATPEAQGDSLGPVAGEGTGAPGALFCGLGELDDVRILGTEFEERLEARPKGPRGFQDGEVEGALGMRALHE